MPQPYDIREQRFAQAVTEVTADGPATGGAADPRRRLKQQAERLPDETVRPVGSFRLKFFSCKFSFRYCSQMSI